MSKFVKNLVETIQNEIDSCSPYATLDNVEDEIKELIEHLNSVQAKIQTHNDLCGLLTNSESIDSVKKIFKDLE